jgi:hypothetical protein
MVVAGLEREWKLAEDSAKHKGRSDGKQKPRQWLNPLCP